MRIGAGRQGEKPQGWLNARGPESFCGSSHTWRAERVAALTKSLEAIGPCGQRFLREVDGAERKNQLPGRVTECYLRMYSAHESSVITT